MAKQTYGLPYKGSKNKIAEWVIGNLPSAHTFIDLFAGGCAITHAAILSGKFQNVVANDLTTYPQMFLHATQGKYQGETRWISREDFFRLKDTDPYAAVCFSFGNDCHTYIYSHRQEPQKKQAHLTSLQGKTLPVRVENIERLKRIQHLQSLNSKHTQLTTTTQDYRQVHIPQGATVYADPPYISTNTYKQAGTFDHQAFYHWLRTVPFPVYISEYTMPSDFTCIAQKERQCSMAANGKSQKSIEKLFIHNRWL